MKPARLTMDNVDKDDYIAPSEFWLRQNGKKHTYPNGKTIPVTLEWCIHNINRAGSTFKLTDKTIPTLAAGANCSIDYLIFVTLRSKYRDTRWGEFCLNEAMESGKTYLFEQPDQPQTLLEAAAIFLSKNGLTDTALQEIVNMLDEKDVRDNIRTYLDYLDAQDSARTKGII